MADIHERSHRQYPHDMALAAIWEQGYLTALADLRAKVKRIRVAAATNNAGSDVLHVLDEVLFALIEEAGRG